MKQREQWHSSLTDERILVAAERQMLSLDDPGFCLACGNEAHGVEPDARCYTCESCGEKQVYGAQELVLSIDIFSEDRRGKPNAGKLWKAGGGDGD
jgi:hypothetical protein